MACFRKITFILCICLLLTICDSVFECYFCNGECDTPLKTIACRNETGSTYGCITSKGILGKNRVDFRGCVVLENAEDRANCDRLNTKYGGLCYICEKDLCNSGIVGSDWILLLFVPSFMFKFL